MEARYHNNWYTRIIRENNKFKKLVLMRQRHIKYSMLTAQSCFIGNQ